MANSRSATPADVEKSIQIALDAADAAMDVTSEYAKVAQQIKRSTSSLSNIEKLGRIGVIIGFVTGISVAVLSIIMFFQANSKLKLLMQTNTELLTVFVENVDMFNENLAKLDPALNDIDELALAVKKASNDINALGDKSDMVSQEMRVAIERVMRLCPPFKGRCRKCKSKPPL